MSTFNALHVTLFKKLTSVQLNEVIVNELGLELLQLLEENQIIIDKNKLLHEASIKGRLDIVIYLKDKGVDLHQGEDDAFRFATFHNHLNLSKYLLEHGANINSYCGDALKCSIMYKNLSKVKFLIDNGANINLLMMNDYKKAIQINNLEILQLLSGKRISDCIGDNHEITIKLKEYLINIKIPKIYYGIKSKDKQDISFPDILEIQKDDYYHYVYLLEGITNDMKNKEELMEQLVTSFNTGDNKVTGPEFYIMYV